MNLTVPGLLKGLLCAVLLALPSLPAWAIARPENRVGGSPVFSSNIASQENAKPIEPPQENPACGYDFASGMHKYLYCKGNPINGWDPSGHDGDLISFSVASTIGTALDSAYNGNVITVGNALQASIFGVYNGYGENQVLATYQISTAVGVVGGYVIGKIVSYASRSIAGAIVRFIGSESAESRQAATEAQALLNASEAAQTEAEVSQSWNQKLYGGIDNMVPGTLEEGTIIYSTTPPDKTAYGLWATDARSMMRAAGSKEAYLIGTQTVSAKDTIYVYRVNSKAPCAGGNADWNKQNGEGGFVQYFFRKDDVARLEKVGEIPMQ